MTEKTSLKNEKVEDYLLIKLIKLGKFFFSYNGKIKRLKYFFGSVVLKIFSLSLLVLKNYFLVSFIILTLIYSQLALVQKRSRDIGSSGTIYLLSILLLWFGTTFLPYFEGNSVLFYMCCLFIAIGIIANLCLLFTKSKKTKTAPAKSILSKYPILTAISCFAIFWTTSFCIGYQAGKSFPEELLRADRVIYKHTEVYPQVCKEYGYELSVYPRNFLALFKDKIEKVDKISKQFGLPYSEIVDYIKYSPKYQKLIEDEVRAEIESLRKEHLREFAADKNKANGKVMVSVEDINDILVAKDICRELEKLAETPFFTKTDDYQTVVDFIKKVESFN